MVLTGERNLIAKQLTSFRRIGRSPNGNRALHDRARCIDGYLYVSRGMLKRTAKCFKCLLVKCTTEQAETGKVNKRNDRWRRRRRFWHCSANKNDPPLNKHFPNSQLPYFRKYLLPPIRRKIVA